MLSHRIFCHKGRKVARTVIAQADASSAWAMTTRRSRFRPPPQCLWSCSTRRDAGRPCPESASTSPKASNKAWPTWWNSAHPHRHAQRLVARRLPAGGRPPRPVLVGRRPPRPAHRRDLDPGQLPRRRRHRHEPPSGRTPRRDRRVRPQRPDRHRRNAQSPGPRPPRARRPGLPRIRRPHPRRPRRPSPYHLLSRGTHAWTEDRRGIDPQPPCSMCPATTCHSREGMLGKVVLPEPAVDPQTRVGRLWVTDFTDGYRAGAQRAWSR